MSTSLVDLFLMVNFATRLALPFRQWPAYKTGVIDESGSVLVSPDKRTAEQSKSFQTFDVVVRNLKRILEVVPGGANPIVSTAAALLLLKEYRGEIPEEVDSYEGPLIECIKLVAQAPVLAEDMSVVGGGAVAGTDGTTGVSKFSGRRVFKVGPKGFHDLRNGKQPYVNYKHSLKGEDKGAAEAMKTYADTFPKAGIIAQCSSTGHMVTVKHGKALAANEQAEIDARMIVLEQALGELDDRFQNLQEGSWADMAMHLSSLDSGQMGAYASHLASYVPKFTDGASIAGLRDTYGKTVKKVRDIFKRHKTGELKKDIARAKLRARKVAKAGPKLAKIKAAKAAKVAKIKSARVRLATRPRRKMNMG